MRHGAVIGVALIFGVAAVAAADPAAEPPTPDPATAAAIEAVSVRQQLDAHGIAFGGSATSDVSTVRSPGTGAAYPARALVDGRVAVDLERLVHWRGASAFVDYYSKQGRGAPIDSVQGFSNIDADNFHRVGEAWVQQTFAADRIRVKIGRVDANSEFAGVSVAGDFMNPSMGYSPAILMFPTYPNPRLSINVAVDPTPWLGGSVATYRAMDEGCPLSVDPTADRFDIVEARTGWFIGETRPGRARVGAWRHTTPLVRLDGAGAVPRPSPRPYVALEQTVWSRPAAVGDDGPNVSAFFQHARSDALVSTIDAHTGGGLFWRGMPAGRGHDSVGVGVTRVHVSRLTTAADANASETIVGVFYAYRLSPHMKLEPDLQYAARRHGMAPARSTVAITYRMRVDF